MNNPGQPLLTVTMVDHCSITMVKPCLTIVKTNHASPILQKCQNHGEAWFNHCIPCYSMVLQLWFSMVKHGLTMVKHGYTHIISQGKFIIGPYGLWGQKVKGQGHNARITVKGFWRITASPIWCITWIV